jgi:hypothetical protein
MHTSIRLLLVGLLCCCYVAADPFLVQLANGMQSVLFCNVGIPQQLVSKGCMFLLFFCVPSGPVLGHVAQSVSTVREFLGIPFAQPPVGALRWQPPVPNQPWGPAVLTADKYGYACMQTDSTYGPVSEDCLTLSVWSPLNASAANPLPVLLYVRCGCRVF